MSLPSPGVGRRKPVPVVPAVEADYFELAYFNTSNRSGGIVVEVYWNAFRGGELVKNFGPATFSGAGLVQVAADALARAKALEASGVAAGLAYMMGQRDAIYARLQADGHIPQEV